MIWTAKKKIKESVTWQQILVNVMMDTRKTAINALVGFDLLLFCLFVCLSGPQKLPISIVVTPSNG